MGKHKQACLAFVCLSIFCWCSCLSSASLAKQQAHSPSPVVLLLAAVVYTVCLLSFCFLAGTFTTIFKQSQWARRYKFTKFYLIECSVYNNEVKQVIWFLLFKCLARGTHFALCCMHTFTWHMNQFYTVCRKTHSRLYWQQMARHPLCSLCMTRLSGDLPILASMLGITGDSSWLLELSHHWPGILKMEAMWIFQDCTFIVLTNV